MHTKKINKFVYTYLTLPEKFYSIVEPEVFEKPEIILFNEKLANEIGFEYQNDELLQFLIGKDKRNTPITFAQAYSGHQFGYFTNLGDGRALLLGEFISKRDTLLDFQLKGSGRTPYSRKGDGKATLRAMLREYLISEAMYALGIPTSRSLAIIKTGQKVYREKIYDGAALLRVMSSHIRIGTFELASHFFNTNELKLLKYYTIKRLYPEIEINKKFEIDFFEKVMEKQIDLIVNWMRVGFIHGVMNTDNIAISGETFDYGPCAFMNTFDYNTVYSSIDHYGRYSFGNQPSILKWNLMIFLQAILSDQDLKEDEFTDIAKHFMIKYDKVFEDKFYHMMLNKLGLSELTEDRKFLVKELIKLIQILKLDYTNTFIYLTYGNHLNQMQLLSVEFQNWMKNWLSNFEDNKPNVISIDLMKKNNPFIIPRNHLVEEALDEAEYGNLKKYNNLLKKVTKPYNYLSDNKYLFPPSQDFEIFYKTYCGT
jgi:uncharacterized protein YdiU (UPF0061 family)